jgi:predicted ATPase/DNA-binding CsgD family transcriptional regulator
MPVHHPARAAARNHDPGAPEFVPFYSFSPLVGRKEDLASLHDLILSSSVRLLTITGPAGVGKSRLAAAAFHEIRSSFADGGHYADLASVAEDADLAAALLGVLGAPAAGGTDPERTSRVRLAEYLADRECVLLLDHCEHMARQATALLLDLLVECPGIRVLVTSLEPLRIYGECLFRVAPLELPEADPAPDMAALERVPSIELFLQRARSARPEFALTPDNYAAVCELCRRLGGLPLAIELAARRLKLYSVRELVGGLDRGPGFLHGGATDTLSRHRSMRAAIEWSYARLTDAERLFMNSVAIFSGRFRLSDAEAVIPEFNGSCHELLEALVDKNLLLLREDADGELSFSMLGPTRAYALKGLRRSGILAALRHRHADHLLSVAEEAEAQFAGPGRAQLIARLTLAHDDLRAAFLYFASRREGSRTAALAASLRPFWFATGMLREGSRWLEEALKLTVKPSALLAKALAAAGEIDIRLGHPTAGDRLSRALEMYTELGDASGAGRCLHQLGVLADSRGSRDAESVYERAASALREAGEVPGYCAVLTDLAEFRLTRGELAEAHRLAEQASRLSWDAGDRYGAACAYRVLAAAALCEGKGERAAVLCREAIKLLHGTGDHPALAASLETFAAIVISHPRNGGSWRRSIRLLAAAHAMHDRIDHRPMRPLTIPPEQLRERARIRLGDDAYEADWSAGSAMSAGMAVTEALTSLPQFADHDDEASMAPLTPREFEVAELVARGLTNREIARRLGIAEWTVVNHLRKVMRKLGCPSRVHVANWVARRQGARRTG